MSISYRPDFSDTKVWPIPASSPTESSWITYDQFVCGCVKECGSKEANLNHMALGIAGESGEIVDGIKKSTIYNKPLDMINIIEELGDLEFYMTGLRQMLGITRHEVIAHNINKLSKRYPAGYSDKAAIERADKS